MGWDCACVICGGPFTGAWVRDRSVMEQEQEQEQDGRCEARKEEDKEKESIEQKDTDEGNKEEYQDNNTGYDPDVITEEEIQWTETLHVLGYNESARGPKKCYISGPGSYLDCSYVDVEPGTDPNFKHLPEARCFSNGTSDEPLPVFPFHWPCYELFVTHLVGTCDHTCVDKDVLYQTLHELTTFCCRRLTLNYGIPCSKDEQWWSSNKGDEIFVSNPTSTPHLIYSVEANLANADFELRSSPRRLKQQVTCDIFQRLPPDIICMAFCSLPLESIANLILASSYIRLFLSHSSSFWKLHIKHTTGWFYEGMSLLNQPERLNGKDLARFFLRVNEETTPRWNMRGPLMAIANRRRIWDICGQIADIYLARLPNRDNPEVGYDRNMRQFAYGRQRALITSPISESAHIETTFWLRSWDEAFTQENVLETFWDAEGTLVGISVSPSIQRRLFGKDDTTGAVSKQVVKIETENWLAGLAFYPDNDPPYYHRRPGPAARSAAPTLIKGITAYFNDGKEVSLGRTETMYKSYKGGNLPDLGIVGIEGQVEEIEGKNRINYITLLTSVLPRGRYGIPKR